MTPSREKVWPRTENGCRKRATAQLWRVRGERRGEINARNRERDTRQGEGVLPCRCARKSGSGLLDEVPSVRNSCEIRSEGIAQYSVTQECRVQGNCDSVRASDFRVS